MRDGTDTFVPPHREGYSGDALARALDRAAREYVLNTTEANALASEVQRLRAQVRELAPDELTVMVRVARELLPTLHMWSDPVRVMVQDDAGGVAQLVFQAQLTDTATVPCAKCDSMRSRIRAVLSRAEYATAGLHWWELRTLFGDVAE